MVDDKSTAEAKLAYAAPRLTVHGSFEEITQGARYGSQIDASHPSFVPYCPPTYST